MWTVKAEKDYNGTIFQAKDLEEVMEIIELYEKYAVEKHDYTITRQEEEADE